MYLQGRSKIQAAKRILRPKLQELHGKWVVINFVAQKIEFVSDSREKIMQFIEKAENSNQLYSQRVGGSPERIF